MQRGGLERLCACVISHCVALIFLKSFPAWLCFSWVFVMLCILSARSGEKLSWIYITLDTFGLDINDNYKMLVLNTFIARILLAEVVFICQPRFTNNCGLLEAINI